VHARLAASLAPVARLLYRPLPAEGRHASALLRFALRGQGRTVGSTVLLGVAAPRRGMLLPQATALVINYAIPDADRQAVLHIGAGLGYYTAVMAACVGATGRVVAYEVDEALTRDALRNLAPYKNVDLRCGDGSGPLEESFDAILVNAGVTHPLETWLDALAPGGRLMLPVTVPLPAMGSTLGKGVVVLVTRQHDGAISARVVTFVAIYSALGIRDPALDERIGKALMSGPAQWQAVKRLRRDPHDAAPSCWLHTDTCCFSSM